MNVVLRDARLGDRDAISALHFSSWLSAYRGMLPDGYLDGPLKRELEVYWRDALPRAGEMDTILVAECDGSLCGFIAAWNDPERDGMAFIDNLHVDPARRGAGVGGKLMAEVARRLKAKNYRGAYLWVFAQNKGARRLYERLGGTFQREMDKPISGHPVVQAEYVWSSLSDLADTQSASKA